MSVTAKGKRWETLHSLWIGWTFTFGLFNWIAFIYIGFRAKQWKWILWGVLYLVPITVVILLLAAEASAALGAPAVLLTFGVGVASIFHAFWLRGDYLRRLETLGGSDVTAASAIRPAATVSSKERRPKPHRSLWVGWTFVPVLNWVAFVYVGIRAKQPKWIFWGLVYLVPWMIPGLNNTTWQWLTGILALVAWIASIAHAFLIRQEYRMRLGTSRGTANEGETAPSGETSDPADGSAPDSTAEMSNKPPEVQSLARNQVEQHQDAAAPEQNVQTSVQETRSIPHPEQVKLPRPNAPENETAGAATSRKPIRSNISAQSDTPQILSGDELEYQISASYPFPIAFGFRSLMSIVDYRDLYREQLRIAENILAFLASVSLTLLREQDREKADIDLEEYWRSGISPGDWKEIVGRCSKVFSTYEDNPLAKGISSLNIRSEKKGFGHDVVKLIQAKNDYKHDRGPTVLEDIAEASQEVQERLKRCMERLSFFGDYPIRQVEDFNVSRSGNEVFLKTLRYMGDHPSFPQEEVVFHRGLPRGDLFLDLDGGNWVALYPFIVPMNCSHCKARETYFIDLWDPRRGTARMKSFERGHTMNNPGVSEALEKWNS
jgi:hypothetical protein